MLNQIVLMGRLVRDPELRYTQSQTPVASFRIAVDRDFPVRDSQERQTDFIDIVAWRQSAEFVSKYFSKGSMIIVVGRLQIREWTDREGNKRTSAEVQAERVMFGESKRSRDEGGYRQDNGGYRSNDNYRQNDGGYRSNDSYRQNDGGYRSNDGYRGQSDNGYRSNAPAPAPASNDSYRSFDDASAGSGFSELSDADGELPF